MINKINHGLRIIKSMVSPKIFCISIQRTGTTSTGKFFVDHGYRVAGHYKSLSNKWNTKWFAGDYEGIFRSRDFKFTQVFQDDPWWCGDFYKILFHRFPNSKFILFERDSSTWYDSMMSHSGGRSLGNTYTHSKLYRREWEYYGLGAENIYTLEKDNRLLLTEELRSHYQSLYELKNREVREFFNKFDSSRLFLGRLEDPDKWLKLGDFFGIKVCQSYDVHANNSNKSK